MNYDRSRRLQQALAHLSVAESYLKAVSSEERAAAHNLPLNIQHERAGALEANASRLDEAAALIRKTGDKVSPVLKRSRIKDFATG